MSSSPTAHRRALVTAIFTLLLLIGVYVTVDWSVLIDTLATTSLRHYVLAAVAVLLTYVPLAGRWVQLQSRLRADLDFYECLEVVAISHSLNMLLPANSGDLLRSRLIAQRGTVDSHSTVLSFVAVERLIDFVIIIASVGLALPFVVPAAGAVYPALLVVGGLFGTGMLADAKGRISAELRTVSDGLASLSTTDLVIVFCLSVVRWGIGFVVFWLLAASLHIGLPIADVVAVSGVITLAAVVPLSPGGLGVGDAAGVGLLTAVGVSHPTAVSLLILDRTLTFLLPASVGYGLYLNATHLE